MEPVAIAGETASGERAASQQPTAALLLAAFAAAATVATSQNNAAGVAGSEANGNESTAVAWLDSLNACLRSNPEG